jgi:uncharacterized iron-regulated membrane protein
MTLRKVIFWMHLAAGVTAGAVILIMCVTGVALTYERQMIAWADRAGLRNEPPLASKRVPVETLLSSAAHHGRPSALAVYADPALPAEVSAGDKTLFIDPYTARVLGVGSTDTRTRRFFRAMRDWHRWMGASGENRGVGRAISGAGNLIFLFIVLSGIYLWFPRKLTWRHIRPVVWFRSGVSGKARDFNWHNVIGVWSWAPLVLVVATGVVISYPWASNLLYTLTGSPVPVPQGKGKEGKGKEAKGKAGKGREAVRPDTAGLNLAWGVAERQAPGWRSIRTQLPAGPQAPWTFAIDRGDGGQPQLRGTLTVDRASGEVRSWVTFGDGSAGQRLRSLARFTHTGEVLGIPGQTIAGVATLGATFLVYTGIALALRRYLAWRKQLVATLAQGTPVGAGQSASRQR